MSRKPRVVVICPWQHKTTHLLTINIGVITKATPTFNQWLETYYYDLVKGWYHEMFGDESFIEYSFDIYLATFKQ